MSLWEIRRHVHGPNERVEVFVGARHEEVQRTGEVLLTAAESVEFCALLMLGAQKVPEADVTSERVS